MKWLLSIPFLLAGLLFGQSPVVTFFNKSTSSDVTNGLIAQWKLNDGSGTTAADSIGSATANLFDTPTWNGSTNLSFNGTSEYASAVIDYATNKITLSFWMYWDAFSANNDHVFRHTADFDGRNAFTVIPNYAGSLFAAYMSSTLGGTYNGGTIAQPSGAAWHHYAILFDRTTGANLGVDVYVDAVAQTVTQFPSPVVDNVHFDSSTLYWMVRGNGGADFGNGTLDDVRVYNRLLTAGDVTTLFNNGAR